MPHLRSRHLLPAFNQLCAHAKIVGILGHRQVGKTTFIEANTADYKTLDDPGEFQAAKSNPTEFLARLKGHRTAIDECQLVPGLFPALKLRVQKNHKPGQFVLSGSVRFTSRKAIRESLTGRISNLELFPLVVTELDSEPLSDFFPRLLVSQDLSSFLLQNQIPRSILRQRRKTIQKYLSYGGLPGICFIREPSTRDRMLRDVVSTILDRDLRLIYLTTLPLSSILELCQALAQNPLAITKWSTLHKKTGLAEKTLRNLMNALEGVFLLRKIPVEGEGSRGYLYFFEDQLEESFFRQSKADPFSARTSLIYRNIRAQFEYRLGFTPEYFHYLTRSKTMVPLAIRFQNQVVGIFPVSGRADIGRAQMAAAGSFLRTYERAKVVFLGFETFEAEVLNNRTLLIPVENALY